MNPLHLNISTCMQVLHIILHIFLMVLTKRIILSINQEYVCAVFSYSFPNSFMCIFLLDELFWTALHQLYQWKTATAFQSHNVHFGAGTVSNFLRVSLDVPSSAVFDFLQLLDKRCQNFYTIQDILNMSFMHLTCFEVVGLVATMNWVQFWTRYV